MNTTCFSKILAASLLLLVTGVALRAQEAQRYYREDVYTPDDVEFSIVTLKNPEFPLSLKRKQYTDGYALFAIAVNYNGKLDDMLLLEATHVDFGTEVEKVVEYWHFSVPKIRGEPSSIITSLKVNFKHSGLVVYETAGTQSLSTFLDRTIRSQEAYRISELSELDTVPEPIYIDKPQFHVDLLNERDYISAVFEFYIDTEGNVRMPALRSAGEKVDEQLLVIAQESLLEWKFNPPLRRGKPVVVKAAQPFRFQRKQLALVVE